MKKMNLNKKSDVVLVQPSGMYWQPGSSRGHSTSDAYELALLNQVLIDEGISSDYLVQRPLGSNKKFYKGVKRITPAALDTEKFANQILEQKPKIVGLEIMSCYSDNAIKLAERLKLKNEKLIIVVGGYHPSGYPEILKETKAIDYVVLGAAEKTFSYLVKKLLTKKDPFVKRKMFDLLNLKDPKRRLLINKSAYAYVFGKEIKLIERLDSDIYDYCDDIPIPKRKEEYQQGSVSGMLSIITPPEQVMATMQTKRGCDGVCSYCASPNVYGYNAKKLTKYLNFRSINNVVLEIKYLSKIGINFIFFTDPTFNSDGKFMESLAKQIIAEKKKGTILKDMALYGMFTPFGSSEMKKRNLSMSQYNLLKKAGFTRIAFGAEIPDDKILKKLRRKNTISDLQAHLKSIHKLGIFTRGFMMYGHNEETLDSLKKYSDIMKKLYVDEWRLAPMTPFVGTETGDAFLATQKKIDFSKHDAINPVAIPPKIRKEFSSEEEAKEFLIEWRKTTLKEVYTSKKWIERIRETYKNFPELREGIDFYLKYLEENLETSFKI